MKDTWNELLEFESKDLIKVHFKEKHNSEVNDWKVQEIASNFVQGREYFRSAREASIIVKPLLLYYGVASLSRALVLILKPKTSERNLIAAHGLEIKNWPEVLSTKAFEDIEITIRKGALNELIEATDNLNYFRVSSSEINFKAQMRTPLSGFKLSLKDVFPFLPDLRKEYKIWTGALLPVVQLAQNGIKVENETTMLSVYNYEVDDHFFDLIFPLEYCQERNIKRSPDLTVISYKGKNWGPNFTQRWFGAFDIGDLYIVPVLPGDTGLNLLSSMFIISYTFGMMARYFPTTWISLGRVQKGDKIFPLINKSLKVIEEKFPETILDFLRAPYPFESKTE
jgi:hypothetical protein